MSSEGQGSQNTAVESLFQPIVRASSQPQPDNANNMGTINVPPDHYVVEEEYIVGVPLVRPKSSFLEILLKAGATGEVFTKKEILQFLKTYIGTRKLYDVNDPRVVYCENDPLGKVFNVAKFTIDEVLDLLSKNCFNVPDTCIKRKRHLVSKPLPQQSMNQQNSMPSLSQSSSLTIAVCHSSPIISSSTHSSTHLQRSPKIKVSPKRFDEVDGDISLDKPSQNEEKRKRSHEKMSSDSSGCHSNRKRHASVSITYGDPESSSYPWYFQVKMENEGKNEEGSEVLSVQDKDTIPIQDSTDDLWFVEDEEEEVSMEITSDREFALEYDVASDKSTDKMSDDSSVHSGEAGLLVVCKDSDIEFFADCSDEEADTDRELTEGDKWKCTECETRNPAVQRYCNLCWKLRPGWLPDESEQNKLKSMPKTRIPSSSDSDVYPPKRDGHCARSKRRVSPKNSTQVNKDVCKEAPRESCEGSTHVVPKQCPGVDVTDSGVGSTQPSSQEVVIESTTKAITSHEDKTPNKSESLEVRHSLLNFRCVPARKDSTPSTDSSLNSSVSSPPKKSKKDEVLKSAYQDSFFARVANQSACLADPCMICLSKPKTASIIHGSSGHQVCCFSCAVRLKRKGKACPVCRRTIQKVVKNYIL
ncbi:hypothetical protein ACJMK2_028133 [Sinanodonta woodiana]|uniref:Uncharacterized protein n=1 Tax=Sinanodonta woodiana TaxID=1069815 RepID=A0ABD3X9P0_SINWO